jgi:serine/threonine protein kinase
VADPTAPFPDFEIRGELGRGTTGVVYDVHWTSLNRRVALKVPFLSPESERARRASQFLSEAKALASLSGRSPARVPTLYLLAEYKGQPFYARELVDGDTLERKVATWAVDLRAALTIVADVASGVQWVHEQGLVHRNISAANVLLDADGGPRLIGFGRVRQIAGARSIPIDDAGTTIDVDLQGLRNLLQSVCAALGHRIPDSLDHAIGFEPAKTAESFAAAIAGYLRGE